MSQPNPNSKKKQSLTNWARYSGMGIQMGIIITAGALGGRWLDAHTELSKFPVFTILLSLLSVFTAVWYVVRGLLKKK